MLKEKSVDIIRASEIKPKEVRWLWYPYIPYGKVTLIQGDPGDGKSTFVLNLAALLTTDRPLPFTEEAREPVTVIYQNSEDDADDTVLPRFIKAGGDVNRLVFINEAEHPLTFSDERLYNAVVQENAKLLILDPLSSYIGGNVSLNMSNEVRPQFNSLIRIAKELDCAVIVVAHMNKAQGLKALYRTTGSIDIVAAARSSLLIARTSSDISDNERIMAVQKNNLASMGKSVLFSVGDGVVEWLDQVDRSADEILGNCVVNGRPDDRLKEAKDFIQSMLENGPMPAVECENRLKAAGIRKTTAKKAKKELGVISEKEGAVWFWKLP